MSGSVFDPNYQESSLESKIVVGLERLSSAFRALLWEHAKEIGLSPIQIQLLIFTAFHPSHLCNVSHLAAEFNLTKPTISEAIRVLANKGLVSKQRSESDLRAFTIVLTQEGRQIVTATEDFSSPIHSLVSRLEVSQQEQLFSSLTQLISGLNRTGVLSVQRTCSNCRFFAQLENRFHCNLMQKELQAQDLRLDCNEFQIKSA